MVFSNNGQSLGAGSLPRQIFDISGKYVHSRKAHFYEPYASAYEPRACDEKTGACGKCWPLLHIHLDSGISAGVEDLAPQASPIASFIVT